MGKIAVMVDAGYLLVAAGALLAGRSVKRREVELAADEVVLALFEAVSMAEPADELLRIYWYDAALSPNHLTQEQAELADKRSCKLRLGTLNRYGAQKGVDTLMVMDILALSRNKAVSSLLILTGDDDLRPALEAAQEMGVRVHLLGVEAPSHESNQADRLRREADSFMQWTRADVAAFISFAQLNGDVAIEMAQPEVPIAAAMPPAPVSGWDPLGDAIDHAVAGASELDLKEIVVGSDEEHITIPGHVDRRLLGRFGANLDRNVTEEEKRDMRRRFVNRVRLMMAARGPGRPEQLN